MRSLLLPSGWIRARMDAGNEKCNPQLLRPYFRNNAARLFVEQLEDRLAPAALLNSLFPADGGQISAQFGYSTASSSQFVVIGAPFADVNGVSNAGQTYLYSATSGVLALTFFNPTPETGDNFGCSVAVSGDTVVVGASGDTTGAIRAGSAYVFNATTGVLIATLNNPFPAHDDQFGSSVAITTNRVVVGAFMDSTEATWTGSAYVFDASTGDLVFTLNNPTPQSDDHFGVSVAATGNSVVVGADGNRLAPVQSGSAYVFNATTGALLLTVNNPTPGSFDQFGHSVAIADGLIVAGAYLDDTATTDSGSAYVFDADTGALISTLNNPTPAASDDFGFSVAISGNQVVVGCYLDNTGATDFGSAYVFEATTGALIATLSNPTPATNDKFGFAVSVFGNIAVVGAVLDDRWSTDAGSAYVLNSSTGSLIFSLVNATPTHDDSFGFSVSMSANTIVVGEHLDDTWATNSGSAYLFNATTGALISTLSNPTPVASDFFGYSVALAGGIAIIGAHGDDTGTTNAGSAYAFNAATGALIATLNNPTPAANDRFGASVAVSGILAVIGASDDDSLATDAGSAYVFNVTTGALLATLNNPTATAGDRFGNSVAISGNTVVVGSGPMDAGTAYVFNATTGALVTTLNIPVPSNAQYWGNSVSVLADTVVVGLAEDDTGAIDAGAAYVFNAVTGNLIATLNNPAPVESDLFGYAVALSDIYVVVGVLEYRTGAAAAGLTYAFNSTNGQLVAVLDNPTPAESDLFGVSVSISGNTLVVGTMNDDTLGKNEGAAYIYSLV